MESRKPSPSYTKSSRAILFPDLSALAFDDRTQCRTEQDSSEENTKGSPLDRQIRASGALGGSAPTQRAAKARCRDKGTPESGRRARAGGAFAAFVRPRESPGDCRSLRTGLGC